MEDGLVHTHSGISFHHFNSRQAADEFYDHMVASGFSCSRYGFTVEVLVDHDDEEASV
jgi:hypothetical protein